MRSSAGGGARAWRAPPGGASPSLQRTLHSQTLSSRSLRHYARADGLFWLARLGDLLAHATDRAGAPRPSVLGVSVRPDGLDVFVTDQADEVPAPFEGRPGEPSSGTCRPTPTPESSTTR